MSEAKPRLNLPNIRRLLIFLAIGVLILLFVTGVLSLTQVWNTILLEPMLNFLVLLSRYLLGNFGLAIIVLTIIVRILTLPLTMRQLRSSKAMQALQPKIKELQKKYAKDQQQLNKEVMKLYKEQAVNPLGCVFPMLIQFPIWIALYQSVIQALAYTPENLIGLSKHLYFWAPIQEMVPLNQHFLWLDLTRGDFIMGILTAVSMWVLQKMSTSPSVDPQQQSMNRIMLWMMPLMFGFFAITLPSGLSVYWVVSNIIGIVMQYRISGWGDLRMPSLSALRRKPTQPAATPVKVEGTSSGAKGTAKGVAVQKGKAGTGDDSAEPKVAAGGNASSQQKKGSHGKHRGKRKN